MLKYLFLLFLVCRIFSFTYGGEGERKAQQQIQDWLKDKRLVFMSQSSMGGYATPAYTWVTIIAEVGD